MDDLFSIVFPRPSFLKGAARVFDLGGVLTEFQLARTPAQSDLLALQSDWEAVGRDIRAGIAVVGQDVRERQADEKVARTTRKANQPAAPTKR
jgi:hypothetical protein